MMKTTKKASQKASLCLGLALGLSLTASIASSQTIDMPTIEELQAAAGGAGDAAMGILKAIFGDAFAENPFVPGPPVGITGYLIWIFNVTIFAVAIAALSFNIVQLVAESAAAGEPLGRHHSGTMMPIRVGLGVFYLLPAFKGYSLAQALIMTAITVGVGAGNLAADKLAQQLSAGVSLYPAYSTESASPNLSTELHSATRGLFAAQMCKESMNARGRDGVSYSSEIKEIVSHNPRGYDYGICGSVMLHARAGSSAREESMFGFRSEDVNYSAIAAAVHERVAETLVKIHDQTGELAREIAAQAQDIYDGGTPALPIDLEAKLDAIERDARASLNAEIMTATTDAAGDDAAGAVNSRVLDRIERRGWVEIGGIFSVISEVSAAVTDAQRAWTITYQPRDVEQVFSDPNLYVSTVFAAIRRAGDDRPPQAAIVDDDAGSIGGEAVAGILRIVARDSGGEGLVNPLTTAKNLGDYLTVLGEGALVVAHAGSIVGDSWLSKIPIVGKVADLASGVLSTLSTVGYVLVGLGLFLAVWLPLVPFASWFTAIGIWLVGVIEALLFSQLAALAHVNVGGNGFVGGTNALRLYLYAINCLLRPAVLVIAFAFASAMLVGLGTLLLDWLPSIIRSVQGNSVTGIASVAALLVFLSVMLFGLVSTCMNIIIEVPNRTLGWLGGASESWAGRVAGDAAASAVRGFSGAAPAAKIKSPTGGGVPPGAAA